MVSKVSKARQIKKTTLLVLFLPFVYTLLFFARNNQLPANDAANYLYTAVNIFHQFQDQGFWRGLLANYTERGWRPIFFPNLSVPFLLLFNGNLFMAYWSVGLFCLLASVTYTYLLLKITLDERQAALGAAIICLLPLLQAQVIMFYAEAALFPCIIGAIYHLIRSNYLQNKNHTIGFVIVITLAFIIRPIEALTQLFLPLVLFVCLGYRKHVFNLQQITTAIFITILTAFIFFAVLFIPFWHNEFIPVIDNGGKFDKEMAAIIRYGFASLGAILLIAGAVKGFVAFYGQNSASKNYLVSACLLISAAVLAWFLPFSFETFQWIYKTSLGDVAMGTGALTGSAFSLEVLSTYIQEEGLLVTLMVSSAAIITIILSAIKQHQPRFPQPFIYLLLLVPFPIWEAFYTVQIVTRKLSIAFPAILTVLLVISLQNNKRSQTAIRLCFLLMLSQLFLLIAQLYTGDKQNTFLRYTIGYFIPRPITLNPNPHDIVLAFLDTQAALHSLRAIGLEVMPGTPDARHPIEAEPINPFLFSMILSAKKSKYYANYLYFSTFNPDNLKNEKQYHAIFLSDLAASMVISPSAAATYWEKFNLETNPSIKTFYQLLYFYSRDKLAAIGWQRGPCISITSAKHALYRGCLLLPITKQ